MSLIDSFLAILTPYECLSCTVEGDLLCLACIQQLTVPPEQCYRCGSPSLACRTCPDCVTESSLYSLRAGTAYAGIAKELVGRLKFAGAQAAARQMAARLLPLLDGDSGLSIVPVPTAAGRVRSRGYDQAKLLARELSRQARLPYRDCLIRSGNTHQVGSSRYQRQHQLRGALRIGNRHDVRGRHILLIDDVVTTGATLEIAARLLKTNGAQKISAVVFAKA